VEHLASLRPRRSGQHGQHADGGVARLPAR
jgi:hypothetical protein